MSITRIAIEKRIALRERMKNFASERIISALNEELHNARSRYPVTVGLLPKLFIQFDNFKRRVSEGDDKFEIWVAGIVVMTLLTRFLEEGDGTYDGLKSPELESQLDELDLIARNSIECP